MTESKIYPLSEVNKLRLEVIALKAQPYQQALAALEAEQKPIIAKICADLNLDQNSTEYTIGIDIAKCEVRTTPIISEAQPQPHLVGKKKKAG